MVFAFNSNALIFGICQQFLLIPFFIGILLSEDATAQFSGGSGTQGNPYKISTIEDLQEIKNYPNNHFIQVSDIDASVTETWNAEKGFEPIGDQSYAFTGTFNGNGYVINGLTINRESNDYTAVFGHTHYATIKNVVLKNAFIKGSNYTGVLVGQLVKGSLEDSQVQGSVDGRTYVGGLVGYNWGEVKSSKAEVQISGRAYTGGLAGMNRGKIQKSSAHGNTSGSANGIGGLVGNNYDGIISFSFATGNVSGSSSTAYGGLVGSNGGKISTSYATGAVNGRSYVGGLAGLNRGTIQECFAEGSVTGTANGTGGLIGNNVSGKVFRTYAQGNVSGVTQSGGLIGINKNEGNVRESYATGNVHGTKDIGGFIGFNRNSDAVGYWNKESSRLSKGIGNEGDLLEEVTGLNTAEMAGNESIESMPDFTFDNIWGSDPQGPPRLLWTTPYYKISSVETNAPIRSGELLTFKTTISNTGGFPDTSNVLLLNSKGVIVDSVANLTLRGGEQTVLFLEWQSSTTDKGTFGFTFQTPHHQYDIEVDIRFAPKIVELDSPRNLDERTDTQPTLKWDETSFAGHYQLQLSTDPAFKSILMDINNLKGLEYTFKKPLNYFTTYYWRVRGINEEEKGKWSKIYSFTTIIQKPKTVHLIAPEDETDTVPTTPTFQWSASERVDKYRIQLAIDKDFEDEAIHFDTTLVAPDTSFTLQRKLQEGTEFFWRIKAANEGGESNWSEAKKFTPRDEISGNSSMSQVGYSLKQNYPNPFNNVTQIRYSLPEAGEVRLEVLNMLGQNVATLVDEYKSAGWHTVTFEASNLSSGHYIYNLRTLNFNTTKKFTLIK